MHRQTGAGAGEWVMEGNCVRGKGKWTGGGGGGRTSSFILKAILRLYPHASLCPVQSLIKKKKRKVAPSWRQ